MTIFTNSSNRLYLLLIFCSLFISNINHKEESYSIKKLNNHFAEKTPQKRLELLPPPTSGQLLVDVKVNNSIPNANGIVTYKIRYRYASTTENGTNSQIQLSFPDAYEIVSIPLFGGNISAVSNTGNQYTIDLESPSNLGFSSGDLAAGSSGIFEFRLKFKCGVNGVGDTPAAGTTINLTQNPVFTVSGVSNTATTPSAVTVPTVNSCLPPSNSGSTIFEKNDDVRSLIGTNMLFRYFLDIPAHATSHTYTDDFPDDLKLVAGMSTQQDGSFSSNFATIEVQATNGTWYDISSYNSIYDWIHTVAEGATLLDGLSNPIPGTSRIDVDVVNSVYTPPTPDVPFTADYAEGIGAIRFTTVAGGITTNGSYALHMYVPPNTPIGTYQNCLSTTDPAFPIPDCDDTYITDMGSLNAQCGWWPMGTYGLGTTNIPPLLASNFPYLTKDALDVQLTMTTEPKSKASKVENITIETLLEPMFDFVETGSNPNYWVVYAPELSQVNAPSALEPIFTRIPDYNGTGQVLLRWEFPDIVFPTNQEYKKGTGTYELSSKLRIYYSIRYNKQVPLTSPANFNFSIYTGTVMAAYNGTPTQSDDCDFSVSLPTTGGTIESEKYVKGALDVQQSRYPILGNTEFSGDATYELYVYNKGFENIKEVDIADILPYIGDKEMLSTTSRGSGWSEEIAADITVERYKIGSGEISALSSIPNGILYSNTYNACYLDGALPAGQVTAEPATASVGQSAGCTDFSGSIAANGAKGFGFRWSNSGDPLLFGEYLKITIPARQLGGEADMTNNEVAWNSFAYTAVEVDDDVLFSSEPLKVGVKMIDLASVSNICGRVWKDENANGSQDNGELSIQGITVTLYDNSGNPVTQTVTINGTTSNINVTTLTDALGNYCFYGLVPSTNYSVRLENENNFTLGIGSLSGFELTTIDASGVPDGEDSDASIGTLSGSPVLPRPQILVQTGLAGTTVNNNDFGFYAVASIGNYAWYDDDAEGDQDNTESPASGVTMSLYKVGGVFVESQITDVNGRYLFTNQMPGDYYIVATTIPTGKIATGKQITGNNDNDSDFNSTSETDVISLSSGDNIGDIDLGLKDEVINPAAICGRTWDDLDEDGQIDVGEPSEPRVSINLLDASGFILSSMISAEDGSYCFNNLEPNTTYQLVFFLPSVNGSSYTNAGSNMKANSTTGVSLITYTPTNNQTINNVDCGFIGPFSIGNLVWLDVNLNGIKEANESAISNVVVELLNSFSPIVLATTSTDAYGKYVFTGLTEGSYRVQITLPNTMRSTTDISSSSSPNSADNDDNGLGTAMTGNVISAVIVLEQGGGSNVGANWSETDHGEIINQEYDPASNPKAYYTVDFGLKSVSFEVCNNGIDDDADGFIDCADDDCSPTIANISVTQPNCTSKTSGEIIIYAAGNSTLSYSINNESSWQTTNVFSNLGVGQYTVRVRNDSGCETEYTVNPIILDMPTCIEICNDGIDNDGDGNIDCDDGDCSTEATPNISNN